MRVSVRVRQLSSIMDTGKTQSFIYRLTAAPALCIVMSLFSYRIEFSLQTSHKGTAYFFEVGPAFRAICMELYLVGFF